MRAARVAFVAVVAASLAAPSAAAHHAKGKHAPAPTPTVSTVATVEDIRATHNSVCPTVAEYVTCSTLTVRVEPFPDSWLASSGPAKGTVDYNSRYAMTVAKWAQTVSHEVGGHHDAWHELVAKVGVTQAWTDYYDLDTFGEAWAEARLAAVGITRDLTRFEGKEAYLDCAGPVAHGYTGNYLRSFGVTDHVRFCTGHETVMAQAVG